MRNKLVIFIICLSVFVSSFAIMSFAITWNGELIPLEDDSGKEMYYLTGIAPSLLSAETGVTGRAGVYNIYVALVTRDSGDRLIQNDEDETSESKCIRIDRNLPNALNIVRHIRSVHLVEYGTQIVGLENVEKTYNGVEWVDCRC